MCIICRKIDRKMEDPENQEFLIRCQCHGPHFLSVETWPDDPNVYLVVEYDDGLPLWDRIKNAFKMIFGCKGLVAHDHVLSSLDLTRIIKILQKYECKDLCARVNELNACDGSCSGCH